MMLWVIAGWVLIDVLVVGVAMALSDSSRVQVSEEEWAEWQEFCRKLEQPQPLPEPQQARVWRAAS